MSAPAATLRIGFGCASLGSRVSAREGRAAIGRALDAGIDWFDVAPSYGDGAAERLLGEALGRRREDVTLVTKAGILPGHASLPKRLARPALRLAIAVAPALRRGVRAHRPAAAKQPITGALVTASLDASLRRLGTDRVDVLALHDATAEEAAREDVLRAAEDARTAGKALRIGIASSVAVAAAGLAASPLYQVAQFASDPLGPATVRWAPDVAATIVTHSVFGADGAVATLAARIARQPALAEAMRAAGYGGSARAAAHAFLPDFAFAAAATDVVLLSMFSARHLEANLAARDRARDAAAIARIAALIGRS